MQILIDGDGCPVIKESISVAKEFHIPVIIFVDTSHLIKDEYAKVITVSKGMDSADFRLVNMIHNNDIVVTQDYGVAAMALVKNAFVINENGRQYTQKNIDNLLFTRHINKKALRAGYRISGKKKRTSHQDLDFMESLKNIIKAIKNKG